MPMNEPEEMQLLREIISRDNELTEECSESVLGSRARFAFEQWLASGRPLSGPQSKWLRDVHEKMCGGDPTYENAWSAGNVPAGRPVETPEVLKHLPKRPPPRRVEET